MPVRGGARVALQFPHHVAQPRQVPLIGDLAQEAIQLLALQALRPTRFPQHRIGLRLRRQVRHRVGIEHAKRQRHEHQCHRRQPFEFLFDARLVPQLAQPQVLPELAHQIATGLGLGLRIAGRPSGFDGRPTRTACPLSLTTTFGGVLFGPTRHRTGFRFDHGAVSPARLRDGNFSLADSAIFVNVIELTQNRETFVQL